MLRAERKYGSPLTKIMSSSCQKGSILLGLIITMIVMATLGAGMVYLTTTSTFQELLANNNARAFYAAESGGRYVNALIRQNLAMPGGSVSALKTSLIGTPIRMANDDQFQITRWWDSNPASGSTWIFEYDIVGTVGSGFLQARRKLTYKINPADQSALPPPPPIPPEASTFDIPKQDLNIYYSPVDMAEVDIKNNPKVDNDNALNLKALSYTMGLRWYSSLTLAQLDAIRAGNGGLLNYGIQVQNKDLDIDGSTPSKYNIFGISFRLDDSNDATMTNDFDQMYGISFVKLIKPASNSGPTWNAAPNWYKSFIYDKPAGNQTAWDVFSTGTNAGKWFVVLWKRVYLSSTSSWSYEPLAYQKLTSADLVCRASTTEGCTKITYWATIMVYVEEISGANKITGYLSQPPKYERNTTDLPTQILWAEKHVDSATIPDPITVPSIFQPISWTGVGSLWQLGQTYVAGDHVNVDSDGDAYNCISPHTSAAVNKPGTGADRAMYWTKLSGSSFIQDSSLTTANYTGYTLGDITGTKAREIGLHIFYNTDAANQIYYDNFFIDLTPSDYGYAPGSGQIIVGQ